MSKPSRKRLRRKEADESSDEETVDVELLEVLREEQKNRARKAGINVEEVTKAHAESSAARAQAKQVESEAAAAGGLEPGKADKARRVDQLLMGTFTGGKADGAPDEVNKYMEEYIRERMGVKNDDELVEGHERPAATVSLRPVLEPVGPMHKPEDEERQEGGALAWNTGIAEVELPVDFKLKNIEATEEAKREIEERRKALEADQFRASKPIYGVGGNITSNFHVHRVEYAIARGRGRGRPDDMDGPGGRGGAALGRGMGGDRGGGGGGGSDRGRGGRGRGDSDRPRPTSSDDMMVERFRRQSNVRRR